jgi:putative spermidine/putrescine transport system permease protein
VLWHVHLPLLTPALTVASFLAFLVGWSDYLVTLLVGGGQVITLPMLLGSAASGTGNESVVAVLAVLAIITPLTLFGVTASWRRPRTDRVAADEPEVAPALLGTS